jgi:lipoprotein-anchoring transpeptidase ErfK/SrfK
MMGRTRAVVVAVGLALSLLPLPAVAQSTDAPTTTNSTPTTTTTSTSTTTTAAPTTTVVPPSTAAPTTGAPSTAPPTTRAPGTTIGAVRPPEVPTRPSVPQRGEPVQVTPTLPPPTTTTTIPSELLLPANSGTGRRVVYSNSAMRVWAVDDFGNVVKTHRVSGKRFVPAPGTYSVFSRSLYTYSRSNPAIKWMYMIRFTHSASGDNIGFHEIPTQCNSNGCWKLQTEAQLGQALSGGCVRQSTPDAIWMWNWAGLGTKVVVLP